MKDNTAKLIAKMSPEQRRQVLQKLRVQKKSVPTENKKHQLPEILPISRDQDIPLSFTQQQLWLIDQIEGGSPHYNEFNALKINDFLNISALEQSLTEVVKRHEILRTIFPKVNETPVQVIMPLSSVSLPIIDLQGLPTSAQEAEIDRLSTTEMQKPFDLAKWPLFRFTLLQLEAQSYVLLITIHHIIYDGWSLGILLKEIVTLYETFSKDLTSPLPALAIQYADFAYWQRQQFNKDTLQSQIKYWQQQLADIPVLLELPTDKPRPAVQTFQGKKHVFDIKHEVYENLQKFSNQSKASLFMLLLASFFTLLYRYTNQEDIVVGTPVANRNHPSIEPLIGHFVNMLVLRTKLSNNPRFTDLLAHVKQMTLDAYAHQDLPFEQLVEILKPERSRSYHPLFQVAFVYRNIPMSKDIQWTNIENQSLIPARFDLSLELDEIQGNNLTCCIKYNTDLFTTDTIIRMTGHYQTLLDAIVTNPTWSISELPILTETEKQQLIALNQTQIDYPKDQTIVDLFQSQVEKTPENIAVAFEGQTLSYGQLNRKANQLAHYLMSVENPKVLISICMERSLEMVIALLGILKAGGAYVPLDPYYPPERLQYMLEDSGAKLVVSQSHLLEKLPVIQENGIKVICLDTEWEQIATYSLENPLTQIGPADLAYVIYTSGSTGKPKGCQVTHFNVTRLFAATEEWYHFNHHDVWTLFHSYAFDFSVWEIWGALLYGGKLIVVPFFTSRNPVEFYQLLIEQQVTILNQTPSAFRQLINVDNQPDKLSLRLVIFGGEALDFATLPPWFASHSDTQPQLVNMYGITETTVHVTYYPITSNINYGKSIIGRPIPDLQVWILDPLKQPVPIGVPGEMYVGGGGVTRGYLNRQELTAERFVEIQILGKTQRFYKTGDLGRWIYDDDTKAYNLEYSGRIDHQIKIRGFRIELGEIEATLSQHEAIKEIVVILYKKEDNSRLIAYVTLAIEIDPTDDFSGVLRTWLKTRLPEYMLPANFIVLDKLPLTPNGKIDRKALPAPDATAFNRTYQAPRTETEQLLVDVWSQVLKESNIGVFDNFFERGGDSILSIKIVARARAAGLELSPRDLFQYQTISELAQVVRPTVIAEQGLVSGEVQLTPIQQRFFARQLKELWHFNQSILLVIPGDINEAALQQALTMILTHHDALRLRYRQIDGHWIGWHDGVSPDKLPFHIEYLKHYSSKKAQAQALGERADFWQRSLNLETGPLLRLVLFHLGDESRLLWCIHHLVIDGVSWRILLEDLQIAYHQALAGDDISLPAKTSSYKAWSKYLLQWKVTQGDYWYHIPKVTPLPVDHPTGSNRIVDSKYHTIILPVDTTKRLLIEVSKAYSTHINDLLLTALMLCLRDWTGQTSHLIDLENHMRVDSFEKINISRTVGWFTSFYSLYLTLLDTIDHNESLQAIQKQLEQIPHNGLDYGVLRYLRGEELPQGQILFSYPVEFDQSVQDSLFILTEEYPGQNMSLEGERDHLIEINCGILKGQLSLTFSYSAEQYESATIQQLAHNYKLQLQRLMECAQNQQLKPELTTLLTFNSGGTRIPLFCLPGSGGNAGYFRQLAISLGPEQPVYGLQSPGLDGEMDIPNTVKALARHNIEVMRQVQPSGPYQLVGHSYGGAVAIEMALQLEQLGTFVSFMAILDNPTLKYASIEAHENWTEIDWMWVVADTIKTLTNITPPVNLEILKASNNPWYCYHILMNWLKSTHAHEVLFTPEGRVEELRNFVHVFKANNLSFSRYHPQGMIKSPIDVFCAKENIRPSIPEHMGWAEYTRAPVRIHKVPGSHVTMVRNPHVKTLAAQLQTLLSSTNTTNN